MINRHHGFLFPETRVTLFVVDVASHGQETGSWLISCQKKSCTKAKGRAPRWALTQSPVLTRLNLGLHLDNRLTFPRIGGPFDLHVWKCVNHLRLVAAQRLHPQEASSILCKFTFLNTTRLKVHGSNVRVCREKSRPGFELNVRLQESAPSSIHTHTDTAHRDPC